MEKRTTIIKVIGLFLLCVLCLGLCVSLFRGIGKPDASSSISSTDKVEDSTDKAEDSTDKAEDSTDKEEDLPEQSVAVKNALAKLKTSMRFVDLMEEESYLYHWRYAIDPTVIHEVETAGFHVSFGIVSLKQYVTSDEYEPVSPTVRYDNGYVATTREDGIAVVLDVIYDTNNEWGANGLITEANENLWYFDTGYVAGISSLTANSYYLESRVWISVDLSNFAYTDSIVKQVSGGRVPEKSETLLAFSSYSENGDSVVLQNDLKIPQFLFGKGAENAIGLVFNAPETGIYRFTVIPENALYKDFYYLTDESGIYQNADHMYTSDSDEKGLYMYRYLKAGEHTLNLYSSGVSLAYVEAEKIVSGEKSFAAFSDNLEYFQIRQADGVSQGLLSYGTYMLRYNSAEGGDILVYNDGADVTYTGSYRLYILGYGQGDLNISYYNNSYFTTNSMVTSTVMYNDYKLDYKISSTNGTLIDTGIDVMSLGNTIKITVTNKPWFHIQGLVLIGSDIEEDVSPLVNSAVSYNTTVRGTDDLAFRYKVDESMIKRLEAMGHHVMYGGVLYPTQVNENSYNGLVKGTYDRENGLTFSGQNVKQYVIYNPNGETNGTYVSKGTTESVFGVGSTGLSSLEGSYNVVGFAAQAFVVLDHKTLYMIDEKRYTYQKEWTISAYGSVDSTDPYIDLYIDTDISNCIDWFNTSIQVIGSDGEAYIKNPGISGSGASAEEESATMTGCTQYKYNRNYRVGTPERVVFSYCLNDTIFVREVAVEMQ